MHLYQYLLKNGVKSRETAKYLISNELVKVNNCVVTYPELPIGKDDDVEIVDKRFLDVPGSFWKMKEIQDSINLIQKGDMVLDIESPDGGFPLFAKSMEALVTVLTIRDLDFLKGIDVKKCNVSKIDPKVFFNHKFDVIINEMEVDIMKSLQTIERFIPLLSSKGKMLMFLSEKERRDNDLKEIVENVLRREKLEVIEFLKGKKGIYAYLKRF